MKALRAACGLLAGVLIGSSLGAFTLAVYFGATCPVVAAPGRDRTFHYHSTTVYLTIAEDRWLVGLFWLAVSAGVLLFAIDRWFDPFRRHRA